MNKPRIRCYHHTPLFGGSSKYVRIPNVIGLFTWDQIAAYAISGSENLTYRHTGAAVRRAITIN